jgi:hypothetical protein
MVERINLFGALETINEHQSLHQWYLFFLFTLRLLSIIVSFTMRYSNSIHYKVFVILFFMLHEVMI